MAKRKRKYKKKDPLSKLKARWRRTYRRYRWIALLLVVAGIFLWPHAKRWVNEKIHPRPQRTTVVSKDYNGIDVSKFQGKINWQKVATDKKIQFVYIKATEGSTKVDNMYSTNIRNARNAGLRVGSYHYFLGWRTAKEQFANFKKNVDKDMQDLIPMVDVEENGNSKVSTAQLRSRLDEFMQLVKDEYGVYPLLYSQYKFYNDRLAPDFNRYYILIARYGKNKPVLKGNGKYNIWQFSESGHVSGIKGTVDLDRFDNGSSIADILLH